LFRLKEIEKRYIYDTNSAYLILPLILVPILVELGFHMIYSGFFELHKEFFLIIDIIYIVLARFMLLDSALYVFTHTKHATTKALKHIVLLYLEITVVTILFYAIVYYIFNPFSLFHLSAKLSPENLKDVYEHKFITSFYISTVTFTTLGSGDWIPQTLYAMIAVSSEVILGVIQGGVFVAILIYGHQNREES